MVTVVAEEGADLGDADTVADLFDAVRQPSFQQFLAALDQDPVRPAVLKKRKGTADPERYGRAHVGVPKSAAVLWLAWLAYGRPAWARPRS